MSFVPDKPFRWQLPFVADDFYNRNRHLVDDEIDFILFKNIVDLPRLLLDINGSEQVDVSSIAKNDESGFSEVGIELYRGGLPYIAEDDAKKDTVQSHFYSIYMGREVEPFVASIDEIVESYDGYPARYLANCGVNNVRVHFLDDYQCGTIIKRLIQIDELIAKPLL